MKAVLGASKVNDVFFCRLVQCDCEDLVSEGGFSISSSIWGNENELELGVLQ